MATLVRYRWQSIVLLAVLGFLAFNTISSVNTVLYGAQLDVLSNQQQHADIVREVDKVNSRVDTINFYMRQLQSMNIQERLTMIEANQKAIVSLGNDLARMLWAMITGLTALVGERAYINIKTTRRKNNM